MKSQEVVTLRRVFSESKTAGVFTPEENTEWILFFRKLKAEDTEIKEALKELQEKYKLQWDEKTGQLDLKKTGEDNWMSYLKAESFLMNKESGVEIKKILTEKQIFMLKDKNDYTTDFVDFLLDTLVKEEKPEQQPEG